MKKNNNEPEKAPKFPKVFENLHGYDIMQDSETEFSVQIKNGPRFMSSRLSSVRDFISKRVKDGIIADLSEPVEDQNEGGSPDTGTGE